jgi:hypothetical protein
MTPDKLQGLLAQVIAGVAGGTERVWLGKIGPGAKLPIALHPRSNWAVTPLCGTDDHRVICRAVEVVRSDHTFVA